MISALGWAGLGLILGVLGKWRRSGQREATSPIAILLIFLPVAVIWACLTSVWSAGQNMARDCCMILAFDVPAALAVVSLAMALLRKPKEQGQGSM